MVAIYEKNACNDKFTTINAPKRGCWIHADNATTADINQICAYTGLDYADICDALDHYEIPRVESVDEAVLIFTRHPSHFEGGVFTITFTIILTKDYIITICPQSSHIIDGCLKKTPPIGTEQKSKFLLYILLQIVHSYTLQIKKIRANVLKQERKLKQVSSQDITNLTNDEEVLNQYHSSIIPMKIVLSSITSGKYTILLCEKDQDLLEDLINASSQSEDLCSTNLRSIRSLRDSYQIIFTNQLNKTIKLLTALTIILNIPTMIASLYGMNVLLPIAESKHAFSIILAIITGASCISLIFFQRKKWL